MNKGNSSGFSGETPDFTSEIKDAVMKNLQDKKSRNYLKEVD